LPDDVIAALGAVDRDLSRAVVRVAQPQMARRPHPAAELATFGRRAVIVVNPSRTLEERTGVFLVPLPDGRALISFDESTTIAQLELRIQDVLAESRLPEEDARIFGDVGDLLKHARRSEGVTLLQRNIIVLESKRPERRRGRSATPSPSPVKNGARDHPSGTRP
jgi:hypothetical protein